MDEKLVYNVNVASYEVLPTPEAIKRELPLTDRAERVVLEGRHAIERILDRKDHRLMVVVGPCSIHDHSQAMEYARLLKAQSRFGAELDSLADNVSFGVAPALVLFMWSLQDAARFGWFAALAFAVCMALRLARFNARIDLAERRRVGEL